MQKHFPSNSRPEQCSRLLSGRNMLNQNHDTTKLLWGNVQVWTLYIYHGHYTKQLGLVSKHIVMACHGNMSVQLASSQRAQQDAIFSAADVGRAISTVSMTASRQEVDSDEGCCQSFSKHSSQESSPWWNRHGRGCMGP